MSNNIIFIGMPGCGKSATGVAIAKMLSKEFIDTDLLIQRATGQKLQEIIITNGVENFLKIEERVVCSIDVKNTVIATGGSVVLSEKAMLHLKSIGKIIFLDLPYGIIEKRIKNIKARGIAKKNEESLINVYHDRLPLYQKYADATIFCKNKHFDKIISEIKDLVL